MEDLKRKIQELEAALAQKNTEVMVYRQELTKANESLEKMISQMNHEIKLAHKIQRILSPVELPTISGCEFSSKFVPGSSSGGDYFDIFEHEDKMKFGVLVASCSGYSVSALFLSVLIKLSTQIEARKSMAPDEVLKKMIAELSPAIKGADQAHVFYGVLDRRQFTFQYSSIGNIQAFWNKSSPQNLVKLENEVKSLSETNKPVPLTHSLDLQPRDRLVFATQGVVDAENPQKEKFGSDRLSQSIKNAPQQGVHELRNDILFSVEKFSQTQSPKRDLTVLVLEVKDKVIKLAK